MEYSQRKAIPVNVLSREGLVGLATLSDFRLMADSLNPWP